MEVTAPPSRSPAAPLNGAESFEAPLNSAESQEAPLKSVESSEAFKKLKARKMLFPNQVACARDYSMTIPSSHPKKLLLLKLLACSLQNEKGHFLFEEVFKALEESYSAEEVEKSGLLGLLDKWTDNSSEVESLGMEGDFHAYRLKA